MVRWRVDSWFEFVGIWNSFFQMSFEIYFSKFDKAKSTIHLPSIHLAFFYYDLKRCFIIIKRCCLKTSYNAPVGVKLRKVLSTVTTKQRGICFLLRLVNRKIYPRRRNIKGHASHRTPEWGRNRGGYVVNITKRIRRRYTNDIVLIENHIVRCVSAYIRSSFF